MKTFFQSLADIERYIDPYQRAYALRCKHCDAQGHLIGHGFIYKQVSMLKRNVVGKHLVCSNRFGHTGCGRTVQLLLAEQLPNRQYGAIQLSVFILLLLANVSVVTAYQQATGQVSTRHAWRWLNALKASLMYYRLLITSPPPIRYQHARSQHPIWSALAALCATLTGEVCLAFQLQTQIDFI